MQIELLAAVATVVVRRDRDLYIPDGPQKRCRIGGGGGGGGGNARRWSITTNGSGGLVRRR